MDVERCTTEKNDQYLGPDDDDLDANEVFIFEHPFKYVELVVETAAIPLVEDLHEDKSIEHQCLQLILFMYSLIRQDTDPSKIEDERNDKLENCLANDHLPHVQRDQWR